MLRVSSILYLQGIWSRPCIQTDENNVATLSQQQHEYHQDLTVVEQEVDTECTLEAVASSSSITDTIVSSQHSICSFPECPEASTSSSVPSMIIKTVDRVYYDDDIDLDDEDEEEEEEEETPVLTPVSSSSIKSFPKRLLHRARSSILEESTTTTTTTRSLGRRTSLFLEKISQPTTPNLLRRQSARLTGQSKKLSKKIKRVFSFHQSP